MSRCRVIASAALTPRVGAGHVEHDALHERRHVGAFQRGLERVGQLLARGRGGVEVHVDRLALRVLGRAAGDRAGDVVEVLRVDERGREVVAAPVGLVAGGDVGRAVARDAAPERRELTLAVPAAGHDLEHRRVLARAGLAHALDDLRREQLRRGDDGLDVLGAVGAVRVLQQRVEVAARAPRRPRPGAAGSAAGRSSGCAAGAPGRRAPGRGARWPARGGRARRGTRRRRCRRARRRSGGAARGSRPRRRARGRRAPGRRRAGSTPPRAPVCGRGSRPRSGRARAGAASRSARAAARPWRRASAGTRAGTPAGCAAARAPDRGGRGSTRARR